MGGNGSGRKANPFKTFMPQKTNIVSVGGQVLELPNYGAAIKNPKVITDLDASYLRLDGSNDPITGGLLMNNTNLELGSGNFKETVTLAQATGEERALDINYTTNKLTSGDDIGIYVNQTDTASPGTSYLMELNVGGVQKFWVQNNGAVAWFNNVTITNGTALNTSSNGTVYFCNTATTGTGNKTKMSVGGGTSTATSGNITSFTIVPVYNQASGTCANTDLLINRTETAVGSGTQSLIDAQVGSTSKFRVDNTGMIDISNITAGASNMKITATSDTPTTTWTSGTPSANPSGFMEIRDGANVRYIPFWA